MEGLGSIEKKISTFKQRFYLSLLLRGLLLTLGCVLGYFLLAAWLEYLFWLPTALRFLLVVLFIGLFLACVYAFLRQPLLFYLKHAGMTDEEAAAYIGKLFPDIRDRLLNVLQLSRYTDSPLAQASVEQKARKLQAVPFEKSVDLRANKRYLPYLALPAAVLFVLLLVNASVITRSTYRIVHFNKPFAPEAPFSFILLHEKLQAFRNEDFELQLLLDGTAIPEQVYLVAGPNRYLMHRFKTAHFTFLFEKIQHPVAFHFEAAGFRSPQYQLTLADRPELESLKVDLVFPAYLNRKPESLINAGPLLVPEGTRVTWTTRSNHTQQASILVLDGPWESMQRVDNQLFTYSSVLRKSGRYEIQLRNEFGSNPEAIRYPIEVVPDQYPQIQVTHLPDSVFYRQLVTGGIISDDYGITALRVVFHMKKAGRELPPNSRQLPVTPGLARQSFYYLWPLDTLQLKPGDELSYYLEVFDNDGVNGRKATRSAVYTLRLPDQDKVRADIARTAQQTLDGFRQGTYRAKAFKNELNDLQQKFKAKQTLDWQDKKRLEELVEKRKSLDEFLRQLNQQHRDLETKKEGFTEQDERIVEKARQLQKLLDELLDEETRKLLDELQRLLQETTRTQDIQKLLEQLNRDSRNLEKELQRAYELLKRHQLEYLLEQTAQNLDELVKKQQELLKETEDAAAQKANNPQTQNLAEKQDEIKSAFEKARDELKQLEHLSKETGESLNLPPEAEQEETEHELEKSRDALQQNNPNNARGPQQKAIEKMQQMSQSLKQEMEGAMIEINMQNLESLRHILHGLITLSFDQEKILEELRILPGNDPRFPALAQQQLKLQDDFKVLEDSLLSLASRDPMMGSFVTREITNLNEHLQKAIEANREKRRGPALNAMQLSMTTINNLALMLDNHYDAMMQLMANAKPARARNNKGSIPKLSEWQRQLNEKIEQLKNSGMQGRQLSEELARLAAEQERIRKALKEFEEKLKKQGGSGVGDELPQQMEETELDLVNKQLTEELIQRQRQILTRLLDAEKSAREQDFDEERKGETARDYEKIMPKAIEEYLKQKEKETEWLRTLPPRLAPYYQREIDEYLKRLRETL